MRETEAQLTPEEFWILLTGSLKTGLAISGVFFVPTATGLSLLNEDRKQAIASWLMGAKGSEESWSRSFVAIFDALFGRRHLSLRCIATSVAASLLAVVALWLLLGLGQSTQERLAEVPELGQVLLIGLMVNVVADYISLLETRWLLGHMDRFQKWWQQVLVLLADLLITGAIIWVVLWIFVSTGTYDSVLGGGDASDFGQVILLFSPLAVFFYSTFVTSIWVWVYILSTWIMRTLAQLRLARWFDIERHAAYFVALALSTAFEGYQWTVVAASGVAPEAHT